MKFGIREICEVVLRATAKQKLGNKTFYKGEPVLYFDTLKTSSLEGAAASVYAQGGRGNSRLIAWEGDRTLTFNMQDALISAESLSVLTGAEVIEASSTAPIYVHQTSTVQATDANTITLTGADAEEFKNIVWNGGAKWKFTKSADEGVTSTAEGAPSFSLDAENFHASADIFCMLLKNGEIAAEPCVPESVTYTAATGTTPAQFTITCKVGSDGVAAGDVVLLDYYVKKTNHTKQLEITADKFAGNYYLEASTLFRDEATGVDLPAEFIIPNGKIQSNFTFSMAATGDPSVFDFVMDAFPGYTRFNPDKKVLCAIQIMEDAAATVDEVRANCTVEEEESGT